MMVDHKVVIYSRNNYKKKRKMLYKYKRKRTLLSFKLNIIITDHNINLEPVHKDKIEIKMDCSNLLELVRQDSLINQLLVIRLKSMTLVVIS